MSRKLVVSGTTAFVETTKNSPIQRSSFRFVCAIRLESRILMFLVRLPFTCLVQSSTTVNTTCEIFVQYKVLWLIKPLEQCQLLQSATGVICKELQALKVKAI